MRIVAAMFKHETNTFSPVPTPLARFGEDGPYWGQDAMAAYRGTGTPLGAFIEYGETADAEIVVPVAAEAWPSGPVEDTAFRRIADAIAEAVSRGCDAVMLDLHGAMVTQSHQDGEGILLEQLRRLAPDTPVVAALDFHANLTGRMVTNADALIGYKTYPHLDMYETGLRVARLGLAAVKKTCKPTMAWGNRPMLPHIMRQATDDAPMSEIVAAARREESGSRILAATVLGGFPHADIYDAGLSAVVVTDNDIVAADEACTRLLDTAWLRRGEFVFEAEPAAEAVARAAQLGGGEGPVLLLDHADNCGSGGTQDVMTVIAEIIGQGLENAAAFAVCDRWAVEEMAKAGTGAQVTLPVGGKLDMPSIGLEGRPLEISGTVKTVCDGTYTIRGPMYTGVRVSMGRAAVLDTGRLELVVTERHHEPWDAGCLEAVGIDPAAKRFVMLKSRVHWRAGFGKAFAHVVPCQGDGVTTSDYGRLPFERVRRPIFPLDPEAGIEPED
jgi:microcystin degradation protein MlrC